MLCGCMRVLLCDELCVVLFGVLLGGVVCCVVCGCFISLFSQFSSFSFSLSLFLSCSFLILFCLPLSLLSFSYLSLLSSLLANKHCVKH